MPDLAAPPRISARELDVLALMAEGYTKAEIGRRLFITVSTVKQHTTSLADKLAAHRDGRTSSALIVSLAYQYGYLRTPTCTCQTEETTDAR